MQQQQQQIREVVVEVAIPEIIYSFLTRNMSKEELADGIRMVFLKWLAEEMQVKLIEMAAESED